MKTYTLPILFAGILGTIIFCLENINPQYDYTISINNIETPVAEKESFTSNTENIVISGEQNFEIYNSLIYLSGKDEILSIGSESVTKPDNPKDNEIRFELDETIANDKLVIMEYDLYGLRDYYSVTKSINEYISYGGQIIAENNGWSRQKEIISAEQLRHGLNIIRFSSPDLLDINYKVKNITISLDEKSNYSEDIIIQQSIKGHKNVEYAYINGFLDGTEGKQVRFYANNIELRSIKGIFEGVIPIGKNENTVVVKAIIDNQHELQKTVILNSSRDYDYLNIINSNVSIAEKTAFPEIDFSIKMDDFCLEAKAGFISNSVDFSVIGLRTNDMPLLRSSMVNVTSGHSGYRCLPHGSLFNDDIQIKIKYDPKSLPGGYGPDDIRTYYYDEFTSQWTMLELDSIDIENNVIISKTNHFTDFINAILKAPELPQTQAYTPTSLKDMAYADPLTGMNIISPPTANNSGTASLNFPLQIPQGRNGMQPQLSINYSSDMGDGWLGVGWNLQIPAITVETRWGVPTYDSLYQSEEYLINGEQIVELEISPNDTIRKPLVHMETYQPRNLGDSTIYSYRVEGAFHKIIRYGTGPTDYWWKIIDKQGTQYFYGKYSADIGVNSGCVLQGPDGIAHWALTEVRDVYGNYVKYEYSHSTNITPPGAGGQKLYPSRIVYTGFDNTDGLYTIDFGLIKRNDYSISGRYGFLEVDDELLIDIHIKYNNQFIRDYHLIYDIGAFNKKTLITIADITDPNFEISNIDCGNEILYNNPGIQIHCFDYYKEEGIDFGTAVDLTNENFTNEIIFGGLFSDNRKSVNRSIGKTQSEGASVCFGLGTNYFSKDNTLGVNFGSSYGSTMEKIQLIDLNGDGISDIIAKNSNNIKFYKGSLNNQNQLVFSSDYIIPLNILGKSYSESNNFGAELNFNIFSFKGALNYSFNKSKQINYGFFSDINGDGFLDFTCEGDVYFNNPDSNGIPVFSMHGLDSIVVFPEDTCHRIIYNGSVDSVFINNSKDTLFKRDPVKMFICWTHAGFFINNEIKKVNNGFLDDDTIYYSIQHNQQIIYCDSILPGDTLSHYFNTSVSADKGDMIFFRLHSNKFTINDEVEWNPKIYTYNILPYDSTTIDADEKFTQIYQYSDDIIIHDDQFFIAPFTGKVTVEGSIDSPEQSDDLNFILQNNQGYLIDTIFINAQDFNMSFYYDLQVQEGDSIRFNLLSNSNVNWNDIIFHSLIQYYEIDTISLDTTNQFYSLKYYPSLSMKLYPHIFHPSRPLILSAGIYDVFPLINNPIVAGGLNADVVLTIKTKRNLIGSLPFSIQNGNIVFPSIVDSITFTLLQQDTLFFDFFSSDISTLDLYDYNTLFLIDVDYNNNSYVYDHNYYGFYANYPDSLKKFGNLYRGWGQFSYYNNQSPYNNCSNSYNPEININDLNFYIADLDTTELDSSMLNNIYNNLGDWSLDSLNSAFDSMYTAVSNMPIPNGYMLSFLPMRANRKENRWKDMLNIAYSTKNTAGSSSYLHSILYQNSGFFEPGDLPASLDANNPYSSGTFGNSKVIPKRSEQNSHTFSVNVGVGPASITRTKSNTDSYGLTDFMDFNGDRYPDLVSDEYIQFSNSHGGLSTKKNNMDGYLSLGYGSLSGDTYGLKSIRFKNSKSGGGAKSKLDNIDGSFGINLTEGDSETELIYIDINGDGLPDKIIKRSDNTSIRLNTGYGFHNEEVWSNYSNNFIKSIQDPSLFNPGINFCSGQYSWAVGIGGNKNTNIDEFTFIDVNNDGLIDICFLDNNIFLKAYINTGNGFLSQPILVNNGVNRLNSSETLNVSTDGAATGGTPVTPTPPTKLVFSGYIDYSYNLTADTYKLTDINGDGVVDFVYVNGGENKVKYGIPKKVNLLKQVITPSFSMYNLDYQVVYPSRNFPQSKWVMADMNIYDGFDGDGEDYSYYRFEYENPKYHRMERESFGFETLKIKQYDGADTNALCYRTTIEKFHNENFLFKGLKKYDVSLDSNDEKYVETYYTWDRKEISTGTIIPDSNATCFGPYYPAISEEDRYFYEGEPNYSIHAKKSYRHGLYGNVKEYVNHNDVSDNTDYLIAQISYTYDTLNHFLEMIDTLSVYNHQNQLLQKRLGQYNNDGKIIQIATIDGSNLALIDIEYDGFGNIIEIYMPADINNDRITYEYVYDPTIHTFPVSITDYWGNTSYTEYDYRLGLPTKTIDISGNEMLFTYYDDGKLETVTGPNEVLNNIPYTIKCDYWTNTTISFTDLFFARWAETKHYDTLNTGNEFITVNISDGLGRAIQVKKTATILGVDSVIVSGNIDYDHYGRQISISHPHTETIVNLFTFTSFPSLNPTTTTYDVMDRPLQQDFPDNTSISYQYGFGSDAFGKTCLSTQITDQNNFVTTQFKDIRGLQTSITAPLNTITKFQYSPLGQLLSSTDPEDNTTLYSYDMLGRMIERDHPDAGITSYTYDNAGNVLSTQTANLSNTNDYINYIYDDCRLVEIEYPLSPYMNVYYEYGAPNTGNQSGRLISQQDASGMQTFEYGNMGELIKNTRTFVIPGGSAYTFETNWEYDSWNRIMDIQYPDGEIVSYSYDNGGKLIQMEGIKDSITYDYISDILYDRFESRARIDYGNGTYSTYEYNPVNRRLDNLKSYEYSGLLMHDIIYSYDNVGNIIQQENYGDNVNGNSGGEYVYEYVYDQLYRLTNAGGYFEDASFGTINYSLDMNYSPSGNITNKSISAETIINGSQNSISYSNDYTYANTPHTPNEIGGNNFEWDANGNMIWRTLVDGERWQCWDEENRLTIVYDDCETTTLSSYIYDAGGERVWKFAASVSQMYISGTFQYGMANFHKTLYASPLLVVTDEEYTKHYYIEGERVCSKIGGGFEFAPIAPDNHIELFKNDDDSLGLLLEEYIYINLECVQYNGGLYLDDGFDAIQETNTPEILLYFYHPDHLGSASFITDATGYVDQHIQYLPFGELFISQRNSTFDSRYKFTAKELDNETQYTYFGARYLDSEISIWLSVDPLAQERPWLSPYNYCQLNPIGRIDKDGLIDVLWHPDGSGNLVADRGDNEFTLQNYIWKNTGSTITVNQSRELIHTMYNGNPISDITGKRIYHRNIKPIAGDHISTMLNPGTAMVHKGQNDFLNSEATQLVLTVLSFALPAGSIIKTFKSLPGATNAMINMKTMKFFFRDMPALMIALDKVMGGSINGSTLPGALLEDIGYPNAGAAIDAGFNATGIVKNVTGGFDPVSGGVEMNNLLHNIDKSINSTLEQRINTGYENE